MFSGSAQVSALMQQAKRDYVVIEKQAAPGAFFEKFPRHRTLNSINRINTGAQLPRTRPRLIVLATRNRKQPAHGRSAFETRKRPCFSQVSPTSIST